MMGSTNKISVPQSIPYIKTNLCLDKKLNLLTWIMLIVLLR